MFITKLSLFVQVVLAVACVPTVATANPTQERTERLVTAQLGTPLVKYASMNSPTVRGGTCALDATVKYGGEDTFHLVTNPDHREEVWMSTNLDLRRAQTFSFSIYMAKPQVYDFAISSRAQLIFSNTKDTSKSMRAIFPALHLGWNRIRLSREDFAAENGADWNQPFVKIALGFEAYVPGPSEVWWSQIQVNEPQRPRLLLQFDDNRSGVYTAYKIMKEHGLKGTVFAVKAFLDKGQPRYMNATQLQELYADGWDVGNHTLNHLKLSTLTRDQVFQEIKQNMDYLKSMGWTRNECYRHVAYPEGRGNQNVIDAMKDLNMLSGRTTMQGVCSPDVFGTDDPNERFLIPCRMNLEPASTYIQRIDRAIASGATLILVFHNISDVNGDYSTSEFKKLVEYASQKKREGAIDVLTTSEWFRKACPALSHGDADGHGHESQDRR